MRSPLTLPPLVWLALAFVAAAPVSAQWSVGLGIAAPRFSGGAEESATGRSLLPYRPTMFQVGVTRLGGRVGVGLRVHYASSSLAFEGKEALAAIKDVLEVYGATPELSVRVTRLGPEGVVRLYAGPVFEIWKLDDNTSHSRLGAAASIGLEVPFGGRWAGSARVGAAVTPSSPFAREDLENGLEPRALWRREVSAGLSYRM
ncbi:MAG TPA: outer membrane beta-barrel protein [Gemmatimonadales bacterium]|nr:outer membrane beta-barrel protein [Gemmatimonadales bacterium]